MFYLYWARIWSFLTVSSKSWQVISFFVSFPARFKQNVTEELKQYSYTELCVILPFSAWKAALLFYYCIVYRTTNESKGNRGGDLPLQLQDFCDIGCNWKKKKNERRSLFSYKWFISNKAAPPCGIIQSLCKKAYLWSSMEYCSENIWKWLLCMPFHDCTMQWS